MSDTKSDIAEGLATVGKTVGKALGAVGVAIGRTLRDGYLAVDPDVQRHIAQVPLLSYSLLGQRRETAIARPDDGHPPLVFVHGLGGSRGDFLLSALYLRLRGRKRSYRVGFESGQPVEDRAAVLAALIDEVLRVNEASQVDLVAHSLGGIVTRLALLDPALASRVRTLVTLGTPHAGTYAARYGNTSVMRELRPESPAIQRITAAGWPKGVRGVTFWSRNDLLVLPAESAAVEGTQRVEMTPFTHYAYLLSPRSWMAVADALEERA